MTQIKKVPEDLSSLTALAKNFADQQMFDEASSLFELALRFDPENLGLKLNLAQVRYQQKESEGHFKRDTEEALREQFRRNAIDSAHFFGLAALYEERGKSDLAAECLALARDKKLVNPYVYKLNGKLLFRQGRFDTASAELRTAQRYNPFDREIAELLGRVEYERESYEKALEATIDAFLLIREDDRERAERLTKRIRKLKAIRKISSQELSQLFRERREKLQTSFERLELQRERFLQRGQHKENGSLAAPKDHQSGRIELAARLRESALLQQLNDEQIFQLTQVVHEERFKAQDTIVKYGDQEADIYVLEKGSVIIRRPTSYGDFDLGSLGAGAVFGELNYISRSERVADVIAASDTVLLRLDAEELEAVIRQHPALGVQIFLSFWHALAQKLRSANEQLKTFFADEQNQENLMKLRQSSEEEAGPINIESEDKIKLLREQGLTGSELTTLANFSQVKRFPGGTFLFHEGDQGQEMYIILEGKVMISKFIPGGGEEALAILNRGDFFGEMSLIDGEPRSADAKAFQGPVTVVVFNDETLKEVLAMDSKAALDFMTLLCRLICKRLREIDEKVTGWRIMSGAQPADDLQTETIQAEDLQAAISSMSRPA